MGTCEAHGLLVEIVQKLEGNQKDTYDLIRALTKEVENNNLETSKTLTEITTWRESFDEKQEEKEQNERARHEEIKNILRSIKPKKWTPANIIALITALFGGGGITAFIILFK